MSGIPQNSLVEKERREIGTDMRIHMVTMMAMGVCLPLRLHLHIVPMIVPVHLLSCLSRSMSGVVVVGVLLLLWRHVPMINGRIFHEEIAMLNHILVFRDRIFVI